MYLTLVPLFFLAVWFIYKSQATRLRISTSRYSEIDYVIWQAQAYTTGYWAIVALGLFIRPWGLVMAGVILGYAFICRFFGYVP